MASVETVLVMILLYGKEIAEFAAVMLVILACIKYLKSK